MTDDTVKKPIKYETKTVTTVRGLEDRSISKAEAEGWEVLSQTPAKLMRTTIAFRRPKKGMKKSTMLAIGALVVIAVGGFGLVAALGGDDEPSAASISSSPASSAPPVASTGPSPTPTPIETVAPTTAPAGSGPVSATEVDGVFNDYFAERAAANVLYAKAVTSVSYSNRVVHVTMDASVAGADPATFNELASAQNMPKFTATPVAYSDAVGDRLRPAIDSIEVVNVDGTSYGSIDHAGILALNELSK